MNDRCTELNVVRYGRSIETKSSWIYPKLVQPTQETNVVAQQSIITQSTLKLLFPLHFHAVYNPASMTSFTEEICFLSDLRCSSFIDQTQDRQLLARVVAPEGDNHQNAFIIRRHWSGNESFAHLVDLSAPNLVHSRTFSSPSGSDLREAISHERT